MSILCALLHIGCMVLAPVPVPLQPVKAEPIPLATPADMPTPATKGDRYRAQITRETHARFGVPGPVPAIAGQIQQESGWNPAAQSRVGAQGLMQFMPATAAWAATTAGFGTPDPLNPAWSIRAGVWYDRWLYERIKADSECDRWMFTFSAYNGGLGLVYRRQARSHAPGLWDQTGVINPGISAGNQAENQGYGPRILHHHQPDFATWGTVTCPT